MNLLLRLGMPTGVRRRRAGGGFPRGVVIREAMVVAETEESFDFIIVGAGSAGCVLANLLTASRGHRVLLLEAGPDSRHPWLHIPVGFGRLFADRRDPGGCARFYQTTTRNGVRSSAAAAYLKPAQGVPIQHQCGHDHDRREGCRHDP